MKRCSYIKSRSEDPISKLERQADALMQKLVCNGQGCAVCGHSYNLAAHHLILKSECHGSWYLFRFMPINLICLCQYCHVPYAHERKDQFEEWLKQNRRHQWEWMQAQVRDHSIGMTQRTDANLVAIIREATGYLRLS